MALVLAAVPAAAQRQDVGALQAAQRGAIAKLAWMNGRWRGEAITQTPTGDHRVTQTERIGDLLGGTIKLVEGRGFQADGTIGFNAFGVVSFDPSTGKYAFHTYAQGRAGDFAFTPTDDGYVWEIPAGPMTIRYTARLAGGLWTETGERIVVGRPAQPFFVMHLRRIGDSDWPEAGAMSPK
ncbi:MAG: DUF1579 domain-containing protein [Novosphingobium sp.]|nr:DUF1579 domain-containing protein [Novosphingobium sp.]